MMRNMIPATEKQLLRLAPSAPHKQDGLQWRAGATLSKYSYSNSDGTS